MSFDLPLRQIISGLDSCPSVPSLSGVSITENTRVNQLFLTKMATVKKVAVVMWKNAKRGK